MKIFYCGLEYDHYNQKRGITFEHTNFYLSLTKYPGADVRYFKFDRIIEVGKRTWNEELLAAVKAEKPDLVFFFMYSDELDKAILEELKKYTTTLAWFADDHWRFYNYTKFWAKHFTWCVTMFSWMPECYRRAGQPNVIRSQWAANTSLYAPRKQHELKTIPDVAFVGSWSKPRERVIDALRARGVEVTVFGGGWKNGTRVSEEEMLEIFSLSKINLGLNLPPGRFGKVSLARLFLRMSMDKVVLAPHLISNIESWMHMDLTQIKARHFQVPACGGFVMSSMSDDLDRFYVPGTEIVIYNNLDEMVEKIKYYLAHDAEREAIARAGYERTIREHTYENRFREIFKTIGLQ